MMGATAACLFPVMLRAIPDESRSLTAYNSTVPTEGLWIAFSWWSVGLLLAVAYFVFIFRIHRGKVVAATGRHGY
jgi:cytochrome bd-type quinol oxidase subunit 2